MIEYICNNCTRIFTNSTPYGFCPNCTGTLLKCNPEQLLEDGGVFFNIEEDAPANVGHRDRRAVAYSRPF